MRFDAHVGGHATENDSAFAALKMRSMFSIVLFSCRLSRNRGHGLPVSLKTSFCGSMNTIAVSSR